MFDADVRPEHELRYFTSGQASDKRARLAGHLSLLHSKVGAMDERTVLPAVCRVTLALLPLAKEGG